jgi:hypothetical protein
MIDSSPKDSYHWPADELFDSAYFSFVLCGQFDSQTPSPVAIRILVQTSVINRQYQQLL